MRKGRRLTPAQLNRALEDLENIWRGIFSHAVNDALLAKAVESARTYSLRAYDAVRLGKSERRRLPLAADRRPYRGAGRLARRVEGKVRRAIDEALKALVRSAVDLNAA